MMAARAPRPRLSATSKADPPAATSRLGRSAFLAPVAVPPAARIGFSAKLRVVVEILVSYPGLVRAVRSNDLEAMVGRARASTTVRLPVSPADAEGVALRLAIYVQRVLMPLPTDSRCLVKSLVLVRMLSQRSIEARVVVGARTDDGFSAHAWVEHGRRALLPAGSFERLIEL